MVSFLPPLNYLFKKVVWGDVLSKRWTVEGETPDLHSAFWVSSVVPWVSRGAGGLRGAEGTTKFGFAPCLLHGLYWILPGLRLSTYCCKTKIGPETRISLYLFLSKL